MEFLIYHGKVEELMSEKQKVTIIEHINKNRWGSWRNSKPRAKNQASEQSLTPGLNDPSP